MPFVKDVANRIFVMKTHNSGSRGEYIGNLALAGIAGLSGCVTLGLVVGALLLGLWLDAQFDRRPLFTLICITGSVPFTLIIMTRLVMKSATTIQKRQYGNGFESDRLDT